MYIFNKWYFLTEYRNKCLNKVTMDRYDADDVTPAMFDKVYTFVITVF